MAKMQVQTLSILKYLIGRGIHPILYGSQGVSLYLGDFKKFNDIDLLVDGRYLDGEWHVLIDIMQDFGFSLIDSHEHEFISDDKSIVAFANEQILVRDGIVENLDQLCVMNVDGIEVRTLSREAFIRAYEFSKRDGYRKEVRGKNDAEIISLLR